MFKPDESILTQKHEIGWWRFWPCLSICLKEPTNLLPSTSVRDSKRKGSGLFEWFLCPPSHEQCDMKAYCDLLLYKCNNYGSHCWLITGHTQQQHKAAPAVEQGCQLLVTRMTAETCWKVWGSQLLNLYLPRAIASWEPRPIFLQNFQKVVVQVRLHLKWWLNPRPNIFWWSKWRWKDLKVMNIKPVFRYKKAYSSLDDFWEIWNFVWKQSGASKNPPTTLLYTYIGWKIHHFGWYLPRRGFSSRHVSVPEGGYNVQSHFDTKWDIATVNPT